MARHDFLSIQRTSLLILATFIALASAYYEYHEPPAVRARRYVSDPINRLAETYNKMGLDSLPTKDFGKSLLPKGRAEMVGNIAVMGMPEIQPVAKHPNQPPTPPEPHPKETTTEVSEKTTKKATEKPQKETVAEVTSTTTEKPTTEEKGEDTDGVGGYPKEITNNTLLNHNITMEQYDKHVYYDSVFMTDDAVARRYWVDLENEKGVIVNEMLSKSHRRAATVRLSFEFPFYGHMVRNMTVATGGFLYTGDYIHSWLAATQYIAPLMANFDTSMAEDSFVKYRDNGTSFTVEWSNVSLQDKYDAGKFSFQATLHQNGDIVFVYKAIPMKVHDIADTLHPVKVGLSDAYIIDKTVFYIRKKTIYEYHRVAFNKGDIHNWTAIYIKALPTCVTLKDCFSCLNHNTSFNCKWCDTIGRCSSGYDRFLQDWTNNNCPNTAISESAHCSKSAHQRDASHIPSVEAHASKADDSRETRLGHSGMLGVFLVICFLTCMGLWVFHAYRNPHTRFGQVLIKYRPSQWRFRRGEARYTAATIHM